MKSRKTGDDSGTSVLTRRDALLYAAGALVSAGLSSPVKASVAHDSSRRPAGHELTVASYYFGNYHPNDPRNRKFKGEGWSEWELVKRARPRFPGHQQPKVPLWGYTDEADPKVMALKIATAAKYGVDVFIFDWYCYNDGPFLQDTIDKGYLHAPNRDRVKFALMWANHDWKDLFPYTRGKEAKLLYPGVVTPQNFKSITDEVIRQYFAQPSYWQLDGMPYFSFFDVTNLLANFVGSVVATRAALDDFRARAVAAGFRGLHLNLVDWGGAVAPDGNLVKYPELVRDLGFDSVTSYGWMDYVELPKMKTDYDWARVEYFKHWDQARRSYPVLYIPDVAVGWDPSPRADQSQPYGNYGYPFTNILTGNTPKRFRKALELTKERVLAERTGPRVVTIECWNEWTEGSYLEPDTVHGYQYLEAVRAVFPPRAVGAQ